MPNNRTIEDLNTLINIVLNVFFNNNSDLTNQINQ
jgi:hypothetical protein